jgi:hypothetical protein
MPVQAPGTPVQPQQPTPTFIEQFSEGLLVFLKNYWVYIIVALMAGALIYAVYLLWKRGREDKETEFEKLYKKSEKMCGFQANPKRKQTNRLLTYGLIGLVATFIFIMNILFFGFMGLFSGMMFFFTVLIAGGFVEWKVKPFMKSDRVYLRYKEEGKLKESFVGDYIGEYYGNDGYWYVMVKRGRNKLIFPNKFIIKVPQRLDILFPRVKVTDKASRKQRWETDAEYRTRLDNQKNVLKNVLQFNDDSVIINFAKSIERFQCFWYPVFVDDRGEIIDNGLSYFRTSRDGVILDSMYDHASEWAKAMLKAVTMNPVVPYKIRTGEDVIERPGEDTENQ